MAALYATGFEIVRRPASAVRARLTEARQQFAAERAERAELTSQLIRAVDPPREVQGPRSAETPRPEADAPPGLPTGAPSRATGRPPGR